MDVELGQTVLYYNMNAVKAGPFYAKVITIYSDKSLDLEILKASEIVRENNVTHRSMTQTGRMWDVKPG